MDSTSVHQCGGKSGKHTMFTANCFFLSVWSAEGPNPCELAQSPRYRKGPDVCFDNNENVRDKRVLYIALCGEFFFPKTPILVTLPSPVQLVLFTCFYIFTSMLIVFWGGVCCFLFLSALHHLIAFRSCFVILHTKDEPLCPVSRGSTLTSTPLLLFLCLTSGSVSSQSFIEDSLANQVKKFHSYPCSWFNLVGCMP